VDFKRQHYVFHIFTGYTFVRQFPVLHFPPLQICPSFSSPAISTPWNFSVCHFPVLQIQRPPFRLVPISATLVDLVLIFNGHYAMLHYRHVFWSPPQKWMKIDPYYQQRKCSPGILVSSTVRFMRIFVGVRWRGALNEKWRFSLLSLTLSFDISHARPQLLHCNLYSMWLFIVTEIDDLEWPWMAILR